MTFELTIFIQFRNSPYYLSATYKLAWRRNAITGRIDDGRRRQQEVRLEMGDRRKCTPRHVQTTLLAESARSRQIAGHN